MDSIDNLRNSVREIDILLKYAARNTSDINKYQLFNKISIVLLSTKLEVFIEEFMEEHVGMQLNNHTIDTFPKELKNNYFDRGVELIAEKKKRIEKDGIFRIMVTLCGNNISNISELRKICPPIKFNYGKHGQKEIEDLFERHGLGIFIKSQDAQNCLKMINSLISIRNNVIHQDATPGLTHQTIADHKKNVLLFADHLEMDLQHNKQNYYNQI